MIIGIGLTEKEVALISDSSVADLDSVNQMV